MLSFFKGQIKSRKTDIDMGSCVSSVTALDPKVVTVIETAVEGAMKTIVTQLLTDMHLSVNLAKEGMILHEPEEVTQVGKYPS